MQQPSVGRIVHYHPTDGSQSLPAVIVRVLDEHGTCDLCVFDNGAHAKQRVLRSDVRARGVWTWPQRELPGLPPIPVSLLKQAA